MTPVPPMNVHEVMGLLQRYPPNMSVVLTASNWQLRTPGIVTRDKGETAGELRKALEKHAVPTADEVLKELDSLVGGNNPTLGDISRVAVIARRYIEHTKGQTDAP